MAESCSWTICGALRFGGDEPLARAQVKEPHPKSLQDHKGSRAGRLDSKARHMVCLMGSSRSGRNLLAKLPRGAHPLCEWPRFDVAIRHQTGKTIAAGAFSGVGHSIALEMGV